MGVSNAKNKYCIQNIDGEDCVVFATGGKRNVDVIVDVRTWEEYLHQYHWTAIVTGNLLEIKTSINKHSKNIMRLIVEKEFSELDYFGRSVDHINNDRLDNRIKNLRLYTAKLNATNIKSKYESDDMHLIFRQPGANGGPGSGYKIHTNVFDKTIYKSFKSLEEARQYRDTVVLPHIAQRINDLHKKTRDVEFERGLRDKLQNNEHDEVLEILRRYQII